MRKPLMALRKSLILRKLPTGPRFARPEDRLRGCLEGRTALIQPVVNFLTASFAGRTRRVPNV
jgi:hypothetical protein